MSNIKLATTSDIKKIMKFIEEHWKENHILARDKDFFIYEHVEDSAVNFVISLDENNEINGTLGFIKYDNNKSDIATVIWKVLKNTKNPSLGIELLQFLRDHDEFNTIFSVGINKKTVGLYTYFGIYTNYLSHYIMINNSINDYRVLSLNKTTTAPSFVSKVSELKLIKLSEEQLNFNFHNQTFIPHKSEKYFKKRYFNHPIYTYSVFGVYKKSNLTSLIVAREVAANGGKILRIVDFLGDEEDIKFVAEDLFQFVKDNEYEYVDFMCYGISHDILEKSGFEKIDMSTSEVIAPNYFSPFVNENITVNFMIDTQKLDKIRLFKGDGDQDRPS